MKIAKLVFLGIAAYLGYIYYARYEAGMNVISSAKNSSGASSGLINLSDKTGGIGTVTRISDSQPNGMGANNLGGSQTSQPKKIYGAQDLLEASAAGKIEEVRKLLGNKVPPDVRDNKRRTPLIYAAWNGHNDLCAVLLAAGANIDFKDRDGFGALDYAAGRGRTDTVSFLLSLTNKKDSGYYLEFAQLINAVNNKSLSVISGLASAKHYVNRLTPEGQSALHLSASSGYLTVAEALITLGADVNLRNFEDQTPLHWAAWNNQNDVITVLLKHGAKHSLKDKSGNTPLTMAVQNNSINAVKLLIESGAEKNPVNKQGQNALLIASDKGYKEIVELLR
ncbi:MAG: ankyrin repeat domain-containing protein [Alphaproteobacteria bacterium]